jgi:PEP-CTERM motif
MSCGRFGMDRATRTLGNPWALGLAAVALLALTISIPAVASNLVVNGSFEVNGGNGQIGFNTTASGWSVPAPPGSYTFLYAPGTADTTGATGQYGFNGLWGPGNGSNNGLPATSPDGGYFIAQDSDFQQGAISQTINGLTPGDSYTVSFWWAAAQQYTFNGPNQSQWQVSLGSQTQSTALVTIPSHGFSGWMFQSFTYTATSSSEVLSFFANGSPQVPPFALLDGVTLNASTPEPGTLALLGSGLLGAAGFVRRYRIKKRD